LAGNFGRGQLEASAAGVTWLVCLRRCSSMGIGIGIGTWRWLTELYVSRRPREIWGVRHRDGLCPVDRSHAAFTVWEASQPGTSFGLAQRGLLLRPATSHTAHNPRRDGIVIVVIRCMALQSTSNYTGPIRSLAGKVCRVYRCAGLAWQGLMEQHQRTCGYKGTIVKREHTVLLGYPPYSFVLLSLFLHHLVRPGESNIIRWCKA
jgi:hypothetical protein